MAWSTVRTSSAALLLVGILCLAWPGLAAGPQPSAIVVGVPTSLTLVEGRESLLAVRLAVEEINAAGGVRIGKTRLPLKVVSHDLRGAALGVAVEDAVASFGRFLQNPSLNALVVGPFRSEVLLSSMDLLARRGIPLLGTIAMTPASEAMVLKNPAYGNIFRVGLNTRYLVDYLISSMRFLEERFGFKRVYILNQDVAWARTTASKMIRLFFRRAGWHVLGQKSFPAGRGTFPRPWKRRGPREPRPCCASSTRPTAAAWPAGGGGSRSRPCSAASSHPWWAPALGRSSRARWRAASM